MRAPWTEVGSTRPVGVARIALALLVWAEIIAPLRPSHHLAQLDLLVLALIPWVSSTTLLLGWFSRTSAAITGATLLALHIWGGGMRGWGGGGVPFDTYSTWLLGLSLLVLATTPCGRSLSVDRWLNPLPERADRTGQALFRVLVSLISLGLVIGHLDAPFLSGDRLWRLMLARHNTPLAEGPIWAVLSWFWLAIEALGVVAPWFGRRGLLPLCAGFVLLQYPLMYTGTYSVLMAILMLLCLPPRP